MSKHLLYGVLLCFLSLHLSAQQLPKLSFYRHNWSKINPAAIPREAIELRELTTLAAINYRVQKHVVSAQAPTILDGSFEKVWADQESKGSSAYTDNKCGLFINAENDGIIKTSSAGLNYARTYLLTINGAKYGLKEDRTGSLTWGFTLTYRNRRIDLNSVTWNNPNRFSTDIIQHNYLNINAGAFWHWNFPERKKWSTGKGEGKNQKAAQRKWSEVMKTSKKTMGYVGLSVLQPAQTQIGKTEYGSDVAHLNGIFGLVYGSFEWSNWVRYVPKVSFITLVEKPLPVSLDANLRYFYVHGSKHNSPIGLGTGDGLWIGAGWSSAKTANIEVGYRRWIQGGSSSLAHYIQIGFAYTNVLNYANTYNQPTSFELNFSWNFADNR